MRFVVGIVRPLHRAGFAIGGVFGNTMRDIVDRVIACHVLLLQEIGGIAFAFGENRDQHIGAGHFGPTRRLNMDRSALDHALERSRGNSL